MARPFRNEFEKDSSPMSPLSSGSATPTSYKTNVNRQKTKKWVEAKAVDYGGDDWGDDDEYDPPPPPISKPTGLRQKGQALQSPTVDNGRKTYGELPGLPPEARARSNSFDADDEKRNFSSGPAHPAATPATRFSQMGDASSPRAASGPPALHISTQQPSSTGFRSASQVVSPASESSQRPIYQPGPTDSPSKSLVSPVSDSRTPSSDYQARRDFSPSAVVPPLSTQAPAAPQSATDSPITKFPPRKSSMSAGHQAATTARAHQESPGPKPWAADRSSSPSSSNTSAGLSSGKALPFIRPADIYKRAEEEKERQSMESSRPSMDSVLGGKASERPGSSDKQYPREHSAERSSSPGKPQVRERLSSDSLGGRRRTSLDGEDVSELGRRLMPMLAPVQERKSEYGFDGFDVNQQAPERTEDYHLAPSDHIPIEQTRVQSTSPKLPDLNRMSGFGIDMFSQSKSEEYPVSQQIETTPPLSSTPNSTSNFQPVSKPESSSQAPDEPPLRNQPSLGFRSVVNQAFDRPDRAEASVPATPASRSGSDVRRSDSESTGTTGISPIMSRVPSAANPDSRNRDGAVPAVLEVVNETSPVQSFREHDFPSHDDEGEPLPPAFKPGHRRDLSTPSPGNSPARTPDLATMESVPQAEKALLSRAPGSVAEAPLSTEEHMPPPSRPLAEREQSFRPQLPGGWQSYATTAPGNATPSEDANAASDLARSQTPAAEVSPIHEAHDEADYDIAPTTRKHSLPRDSTTAAAVVALGGMAALKSHEDGSLDRTVAGSSRDTSGYDDMPTPDLAMAPSGSVYSSNALDPRLLPKLESVLPEAQLRPDIHDRTVSAASSIAAPTPPPKDTPLPPPIDDNASGYFPKPTVPLKQRSAAELGDDEDLEPPVRPNILTSLSTDTRPQDEESDKLRKEIIKSLSPRTSLAGPRNGFFPTDKIQDSTSSAQARESAYLPDSIYDNYWGDDGDEGSVSLSRPTTREAEGIPQESTLQKAIPNIVMDTEEADIPPTPPLNTRKSQQSQLSTAEPRPALNNRFSWEQSEENVAEPPKGASPEQSVSQEGPLESNVGKVLLPAHDVQPHTADLDIEREDVGSSRNSALSDEQHHEAATLLAGGAAIGGAAVAAHMQQAQSPPQSPELNQSSRRLSLAEEKDPKVSSYPVSPTPPEDEHPANSAHAYLSDESDRPHSPVSHLAGESLDPAPQLEQLSSTDAKLLQFKEIAAMRDPHQRIQAFDEHRHRFAAMDSGLSEWLSTLQSQHSEHADASESYGGGLLSPGIGGSARSRFAKPGGKSPLQPPQPYYQQYLNASSPTTPTTPVSQPGPSIPNGAQQQGFSSGGGKMTSQQVQAKGKELLHTAGIFSGKAGKGAAKAGKGLLAKGKSRFRGSGAGDKTNPPPKPKNERRSSWGLPLALTRSANQLDSSTNSKEALSRTSESREASQSWFPSAAILNNALDLGQDRSDQPPQIRSLGDLPSPPLSRGVTSHIPEISQPASPKVRDNLSGPVPISKDPPSWDPYNSTPIVEEEGFGFDEKPKKVTALPVPTEERSERSNSGDAHLYDTSERPSHDDEWVIVEPELKEASEVTKSTKPPIAPKSILDRPRDSFDITKSSPIVPVQPHASSSNLVEQSSSSWTKDIAVPKAPTKPAEVDEVIPRDPAFKGLPPIRRTSTFGFGFGPRQAKPRFPIDDEDEDTPPVSEQQRGVQAGAVVGAPGPAGIVVQHGQTQQSETRDFEYQNQVQQTLHRPDFVHASSSEYSQQTITQASLQREPSIPRLIMNPRHGQRITPTQIQVPRRSEDSWRPSPVPPPSNQQQYVDPPQSHSPVGRRLSSDAQARAATNPPQKQFEQPPSSAFRYPQLFRPGQQDFEAARDSGELPDHYYQQSIHREEALMPRQQTSEYQLPGVGPPVDEPRFTSSRRNSFFGGLGGKLARSGSRERAGSISHGDDEGRPSSRPLDSRGNEISQSSPTSDEGQTQSKHKRRPSFFGNLNRVSTGGTGPPKTADSVTAQASGSRTDLLKLANPQSSPLAPPEKKRSFFRNSTSRPPLTNSNKVSRASTSSAAEDGTGKKNRFSALSSMFGSREKRNSKGSVLEGVPGGGGKRQSTEGPRHQPNALPLVSSQPGHPAELVSGSQSLIGGPQYQPGPQISQQPARTPSQQRNVLTKQPSLRDSSRQRQGSRSRRTSGSGILSGILGRRSQDARRPEKQSNNPKPLSPQPTVPNLEVAPVAQNGSQQQLRTIPWQNGNIGQQQQLEARGRRSSREPIYDNVPIPGGYPSVRGVDPQAPSSYDVRANNQQYWPQPQPQHYHTQETQQRQDQEQRNPLQNDAANDVRERQNRPPNLDALETYESYQRRAPRRLSREDILARSPAREPEGQQRPYQLSLPEEDPSEPRSKHTNQQMPKLNTQPMHDRIQRLQQPVLRHPESPAGYPLPADTVFSPVNPEARNMPPPPAPRWPQQQAANGKGKSLARSDTGRTGDSEVSQVSAEASRSLAPQKRDERGSSPSPTPPSPSVTPERLESPEPKRQNVRALVKDDDDLYDASPRLKPEAGHRYQEHEGKEIASGTRHGREQEEKIFYGGVGIPPERDDDTNATMSATSYPGQEWHPYTGGFEEWD